MRYTLVVSDFHLGEGARLPDGRPNPLEDFPFDDKFVEFINYYLYGERQYDELELVINGDFFNHIQEFAANESVPHIMTEPKALEYTKRMVAGHDKIFKALSRFAQFEKKKVVFIPGNHDMALYFPSVQLYLKELIGGDTEFCGRTYVRDGVHIEHGDRYETFHLLMPPYSEIIKEPDKEPALNIPWGTYFFLYLVFPLKRKRPYVDKVTPFRSYLTWAMFNDFFLFVGTVFKLVYFVIRTALRRIGMHHFPGKYILIVAKTLSVSPDISKGAERIFYRNPSLRMVVFGHTHAPTYLPLPGGRSYYNTGAWNVVTGMAPESFGTKNLFTFLFITHEPEGPKAALMKWRGRSSEVEEYFG